MRKAPFHQYRREAQVIAALQRKELPRRPEPGDSDSDEIDDEIWGLMMSCWNFVPGSRPTCEEIQDWFSAHLGIEVDCSKAPGEAEDSTAFWESVRAESKVEVDLERVYQILQRVSFDSTSPNTTIIKVAIPRFKTRLQPEKHHNPVIYILPSILHSDGSSNLSPTPSVVAIDI